MRVASRTAHANISHSVAVWMLKDTPLNESQQDTAES